MNRVICCLLAGLTLGCLGLGLYAGPALAEILRREELLALAQELLYRLVFLALGLPLILGAALAEILRIRRK